LVFYICRDFGYTNDDAVMFYSVFGGVPKYFEALEKLGFPPFSHNREKNQKREDI
jgi:hypothetical protein